MSERSDQQLEQDMEELLRLGREEVPPAEGKARALEQLTAGTVTPPLDPSSGAGAVALRKWAGYGVLLLAVIAALVYFFTRPAPTEVAQVVAPVVVVPQVTVVDPPPPPPTPPEPPPVVDSPPPPTTVKHAPPPEPVDELERELALVEEAKTLITVNPSAAWATLSAHARAFPRGALKKESDLLRVEALLKLGKRAQAEALADQLAKRDTEGLVKERLQRLLAQ